jgi:hypothetical protein
MNLRLEQLAKWASLLALIVLIGAPTFNINTVQGENTMPVDPVTGQSGPWSLERLNASANMANGNTAPYAKGYTPSLGLPETTYNTPAPTYNGPSQADIYAQQQAQAKAQADQRARDAFNQGRNVYTDSINQRMNNEAQGYQRGIQDWATGVTQKQQGIDTAAINADMAKTQGMRGIMDMVGNGIQSAGVMLGNRNAGSSSATGAIANAYGKLGTKQASSVGNQYAQAQNQIGLEQSNLEAAKALQVSRFGEDKVNIVNNIINDAQKQIAALNEAAAGASISDRMDIEAEKNRIRSTANATLQAYDGEMSKAKGAQTDDQRRNEAQRLLALGTAPTTQFYYSTEAPTQWQNTGPFSSSMPLYTFNRNKNEA